MSENAKIAFQPKILYRNRLFMKNGFRYLNNPGKGYYSITFMDEVL